MQTAQLIAGPWGKNGTKVSGMNVREALAAAGLDKKRELVQLQLPSGELVKQWAVKREDGVVNGFVGAKYAITQDAEAYEKMIGPFIDQGLATIDVVGNIKNGARTWMLARINKPDSVIVAKADDTVRKFILLARGHDGWFSNYAGLTPFRPVCTNGLYAAISSAQSALMRIRNTAGAIHKIEAVADTIEQIDRDFETTADTFRALATRRIRSAKTVRAYIEEVFPARPREAGESDAERKQKSRKVVDEIEALYTEGMGNSLPGVKDTAWAAYQGVTQYLTWNRGRTDDARIEGLLFRQDVPARALQVAQQRFLQAA